MVIAAVSGLAALQALAPTAPTVRRAGYHAPGDGGAAIYNYSPAACSLNAGAGDHGSQIQASGGGCWIVDAPPTGLDVRVWGAVADGATDAGPAINAALKATAGIPVVIPATPAGFYVNTTIIDLTNLVGTAFNAYNPSAANSAGPPYSYTFPLQSWLKCSATVSPCLQLGQIGDVMHAPSAENLVLSMPRGRPRSGKIGLQIAGGYNVHTRNIGTFNFDICAEWGPTASSASGIAAYHDLTIAGACATHYFVSDGWSEIHMIGGRAGMNGYGDYSTAQDFWYLTESQNQGLGGGVNTLYVTSFQFNPAGGGVACAVRWGGWTGTGGNPVNEEYRFTDSHFEYHGAYTGRASQGIFCSDSTVNHIANFKFVNNTVTPVTTVGVFNLNAATSLERSIFDDNHFTSCTDLTLNLPTDSLAFGSYDAVKFSNNTFPCPAKFSTTGRGDRVLLSSSNTYDSMALSGAWGQFSSFGDIYYSGLTDTATGHIQVGNWYPMSWAPVLNYQGVASGATFSDNIGTIQRTAEGGFRATVNMILTKMGKGSGNVTISGLPFGCSPAQYPQAVVPNGELNMTKLTGQVSVQIMTGKAPAMALVQSSSTGWSPVLASNLTNTTRLGFSIECPQAE
jgi:hypothetical protein